MVMEVMVFVFVVVLFGLMFELDFSLFELVFTGLLGMVLGGFCEVRLEDFELYLVFESFLLEVDVVFLVLLGKFLNGGFELSDCMNLLSEMIGGSKFVFFNLFFFINFCIGLGFLFEGMVMVSFGFFSLFFLFMVFDLCFFVMVLLFLGVCFVLVLGRRVIEVLVEIFIEELLVCLIFIWNLFLCVFFISRLMLIFMLGKIIIWVSFLVLVCRYCESFLEVSFLVFIEYNRFGGISLDMIFFLSLGLLRFFKLNNSDLFFFLYFLFMFLNSLKSFVLIWYVNFFGDGNNCFNLFFLMFLLFGICFLFIFNFFFFVMFILGFNI